MFGEQFTEDREREPNFDRNICHEEQDSGFSEFPKVKQLQFLRRIFLVLRNQQICLQFREKEAGFHFQCSAKLLCSNIGLK